MTGERFYEILGDIDEPYIEEVKDRRRAKKPAWRRGGLLAACLCLAVLGLWGIRHLEGVPGPAPAQPGNTALVVNEGERGAQVDLDVQITHYADLSGQEWAATAEAFERAVGMSCGDFAGKLPPSYQQTAFYSIDVPVTPGSGAYVPHDYVFEYVTAGEGRVMITLCAGEAPLKDTFVVCRHPKASEVKGVSVFVYDLQGELAAQFSHGAIQYEIDARGINIEELEILLTGLIS